MHVVVNPPYGSIEMVLFRKGKLESTRSDPSSPISIRNYSRVCSDLCDLCLCTWYVCFVWIETCHVSMGLFDTMAPAYLGTYLQVSNHLLKHIL